MAADAVGDVITMGGQRFRVVGRYLQTYERVIGEGKARRYEPYSFVVLAVEEIRG